MTLGTVDPLANRSDLAGDGVARLMGNPMSTSDGNRAFDSVVSDRTPDSDKNNRSP